MDDLINTLEAPGEFDALPHLRPGEPYFLLIGRDALAPGLVQQWADQNRRRAADEHDAGTIKPAALDTELRKSTQAEKIGWAMKAYKAGFKPVETEAVEDAEEAALPENERVARMQRRDQIQAARARAASALNNAVSEANDAATVMAGEPEHADLCAQIETIIAFMDHLSNDMKPWRPLGKVA